MAGAAGAGGAAVCTFGGCCPPKLYAVSKVSGAGAGGGGAGRAAAGLGGPIALEYQGSAEADGGVHAAELEWVTPVVAAAAEAGGAYPGDV